MRLYLGNLAWRVTEQELEAAFQPYGVRQGSIRIIKDRETGRSKGYGFIEVKEGERALEEMQAKEVCGRPLRLSEALKSQQARLAQQAQNKG